MKEFLAPASLPDFSAAGLSPGTASDSFVFASSVAIDVATMKRVPEADTIGNETRVVLDNIEVILREAGCSLRDVVKTTCYVSDESHRMEFVEAYKAAFDPGPYPARCTFTIGIAGDCRVQIDAIAYRGEGSEADD